MKKTLVTMVAFVALLSAATAQSVPSQPKQNVDQTQLSFKSQAEKDLAIAEAQKVIELRRAHGRSEAQLVANYADLKKIQNALIISETPKK